CVPVCSPQEKLFQYQPGPRSSYLDTSSMRNGQHWPISGGSAICGNSGVSVCVRSTTRIRPLSSAPTSAPRIDAPPGAAVAAAVASVDCGDADEAFVIVISDSLPDWQAAQARHCNTR